MSIRVLIIDDEANIRQMSRLALEAAGYEVGEAADGQKALALLSGDAAWDVVLLDQKMPGLNGTEVLQQIKEFAPSASLIMVTAFSAVELAVEAMKLGAIDFVRKPMTPKILRNVVAAAIINAAATFKQTGGENSKRERQQHHRAVTLNGFTILRASDLKIALPERPDERRFIVRKPDGREQEVVVEIDMKAIQSIESVTHRLPLEKAFWTEQCERFLSDFLWNDGTVPSGKLKLKGVETNELARAVRDEDADGQTDGR